MAATTFAGLFGAIFPAEAEVETGVIYGPTGDEFEGTFAGGSGDALEATSQAILAAVLQLSDDIEVVDANVDQIVAVTDDTYTYLQTLPLAIDNAAAIDAELTLQHGAGDWTGEDIKGAGWDSGTDTLEKIRDAIASFSTNTIVIPTPISEVIGMPETLEIGDSYDDETPIKLYVRDDADDPVTVFSGHDLADIDFAPTFTIAPTPGSARGRVVGTVTYVPASGPDEGYLKVEISSLQSRRAVEGESSVQCILKWDGYEKTLLSTTVRWLPRI